MPALSDPELRELDELARYVGAFATLVWGVDPMDRTHPNNVLADALASATPRQRLIGLRQAMNDTISAAAQMTRSEVARFDSMLAQHNALTISQVRVRYSGALKKILSRRNLRNDTDFYLARDALDDGSVSMTEAERALLSELLVRFEKRSRA